MRMPVKTILWEQWRVTRWPFLIAFVMGVGGGALSWFGVVYWDGMRWLSDILCGLGAFMQGAVLLGFGLYILLDFHSGNNMINLRCGCSTHQWTLPLNRRFFVAIYLGYRIVAMGVLVFLSCLVMDQPPQNAFYAVLVYLCVQSFAFAVSWAAVKRLFMPFILVAVGIAGFFFCKMRTGGDHLAQTPLELGITITVFVVLCLAAAMMSALTLDNRRFSLSRVFNLSETDRIYWPGRFASGYAAQCWSEWRQHGLFMARCVFFSTLLVVFGIVIMWPILMQMFSLIRYFYLMPIAIPINALWFFALYTAVPAAVFTGALPTSWDVKALKSTRGAFVFTMPLPTRDLAVARLVTAFRSALLTVGVVFIFFVATHLILWATGLHYRFWGISQFINSTPYVFVWIPAILIGGFLLAWSLYCSPFPFLAFVIGNAAPAMVLTAMGEFGMISNHLLDHLFPCFVFGVSFLLVVGGAIYFGRRAWTLNLLPRTAILFFVVVAALIMLVTALTMSFLCVVHGSTITLEDLVFSTLLIIIIGCAPAMVAFFQGSWLQFVRHR